MHNGGDGAPTTQQIKKLNKLLVHISRKNLERAREVEDIFF